MSENFLNLLASVVVYLLVVHHQKNSSRKIYLICGVLSIYATLIKQTGVFIVLIVFLYMFSSKEARAYKTKNLSHFFIGIFIGGAPFFIYLVINSALFDAINQVLLLQGTAVGDVVSLAGRLFKIKYVGSKLYGIFAIFLLHIATLPKFDRKQQIVGSK